MEIKTSYFAQARNLRKEGYRIISIARFNPSFVKVDTTLLQLAPTPDMLKMAWSDYQVKFDSILRKVDLKLLQHLLSGYSKNALCCYEKDRTFCHRKIVGEFIQNKLGIEVTEFVPINQPKPKKEKPSKPAEGPSLF